MPSPIPTPGESESGPEGPARSEPAISLLADPQTIAGGDPHPVPEAPSAEAPAPSRPLMNAASARRLAAEARRRQRESHEALEAARSAQERDRRAAEGAPNAPRRDPPGAWSPSPVVEPHARAGDTAVEAAPEDPAQTSSGSARWRRRALAARPAAEQGTPPPLVPGLSAPAVHAEVPNATRASPGAEELDAARDALRAEIRELRAMLALAREASSSQRQTIAALREALARVSASGAESPSRDDAARDRTIARLRDELEALRDRFEVQDRALEAARAEYTQERARHSESLALLDRLRAALLDGPLESSPEPPKTTPEPAMDHTALVEGETLELVNEVSLAARAPLDANAAAPFERPARPLRGRLFESWQDDQIRRQFGPMGIDSFLDLARAALTRHRGAGHAPTPIVLVGRGASAYAPTFAEGLLAGGVDGFLLHVVETEPSVEARVPSGRPRTKDSLLHTLIRTVELPAAPIPDELETREATLREALTRLIAEQPPALIVCRDFLTESEAVEPWLEVLQTAHAGGASLVFSEGTGHAVEAPSPAIEEIGERIWSRMPDRYTRVPGSDHRLLGWRDAFESGGRPRPNGLRDALRRRFRSALSSQFGFLAEPFTASAIAENFDPDAPRDRRFLRQVAELDERRIEAGEVPALHLVALVEPPTED